MRLTTILIISILAALFLGGCGETTPTAPQSTPALKSAIGSGKISVVFFQNPNGIPCQTQNVELQKLKQALGDKINVVYVSAIDQRDQQAFYDYGIRSLPSLVLLNSKGGIAKYFPPGIHSYETLLGVINITK